MPGYGNHQFVCPVKICYQVYRKSNSFRSRHFCPDSCSIRLIFRNSILSGNAVCSICANSSALQVEFRGCIKVICGSCLPGLSTSPCKIRSRRRWNGSLSPDPGISTPFPSENLTTGPNAMVICPESSPVKFLITRSSCSSSCSLQSVTCALINAYCSGLNVLRTCSMVREACSSRKSVNCMRLLFKPFSNNDVIQTIIFRHPLNGFHSPVMPDRYKCQNKKRDG